MIPQIAVAECFGHGLGYFRFCLDNFGTGFLGLCLHFLLCGYGHGAAFLCLGLSNVLVGIGLVYLQGGTDILTYVNISNVNGQNFECCSGIQPPCAIPVWR